VFLYKTFSRSFHIFMKNCNIDLVPYRNSFKKIGAVSAQPKWPDSGRMSGVSNQVSGRLPVPDKSGIRPVTGTGQT
jgi:hypothetical protein